jgi:hypothetical protein
MRILVQNYKIECFENESDYKNWIADHSQETNIVNNTIYHGTIYGIPQNVRNLFQQNIIVTIKSECYNDTQFVLIHR